MPSTSMRGSSSHAWPNASGDATDIAAAPRAGSALRTSTCVTLRYDDDIASLEHDVLGEISATGYVRIPEGQGLLLSVIRTSQDDDLAQRGEGRGAARHAERLHDVDARIHDELARLVHLAEHIDLVALHFRNRHRHDGIGDEFLQLVRDRLLQLADGAPARIDLAGQGKRERAVRPYQYRALQVGLFPDCNGKDIARLDRIGLHRGAG